MGTILFLIGFPIIIALILLVSKADKVREWSLNSRQS